MKKIIIIILIASVFWGFCPGFLRAQVSYPEKKQEYVNDFTAVLGSTARLEEELKSYEEESSHKINIAVINTLEDVTIDNYANKLYDKWRVGKDKDKGILILVSLKEKKIYIKIGYGLSSELDSETAQKIIDEEISPNFYEGMYLKGLEKGSGALIAAMSGNYESKEVNNSSSIIFVVIFLTVLIFLFIFSRITYNKKKKFAKNLNKIRNV